MTHFFSLRCIGKTLLFLSIVWSSVQAQWNKDISTQKLDPVFWFSADNVKDLKSGDRLMRWKDKSVNNHDAHQHEGGRQPTYKHTPKIDTMGRPYLEFDGKSQFLYILNHSNINTQRYYHEKTAIVVFQTGYDIERRQVIYEEGGTIRGLNISIIDGELHFGSYNLVDEDETTPWGYAYISTNIEVNRLYIAVLTYDFTNGNVRAHLNGRFLGSIEEIGRLFGHPGGIGIGACNNHMVLHDHVTADSGIYNFQGRLYELLYYDYAFNESQSHLIQSYLSAKYDIDLIDQSAAIDVITAIAPRTVEEGMQAN